MSRPASIVLLASLFFGVFAAGPTLSEGASMSAEAQVASPKIPAPAPFPKSNGFDERTLAPYRDMLPAGELDQIVALSRRLFAAPGFAAFRDVVAAVGTVKRREYQYTSSFEDKDFLFTYTMPHDPMLLLGTGKALGGKVTPLPRLLSGALGRPAKSASEPQDLADAVSSENFLLRSPEQICTAGIAYALNPDSAAFDGIEYMPPPIPMDDPLMRMLVFIQNSPNPITLTDEAAAGSEASGDKAQPPTADAATPTENNDARDDFGRFAAILRKAKTAEVSLAELTSVFAPAKNAGFAHVAKLGGFFAALAEAAPVLKKDCLAQGNRWTEFKQGAASGELNVLGCFTLKGARSGFGVSFTGEPFPWGGRFLLHEHDLQSGLGVQLALDITTMLVEMTALKGEKPLKYGPELTFDTTGPALALNITVTSELRRNASAYDVYEWHPNGGLKMIGHRQAGEPVDERSFYENGSLAGHVTFDHTQLASYREWYENRNPAEDTHFDHDGRIQGVRRWWHLNGRPAGEITYADGSPEGDLVMWYDAGKPGVRAHYQKGALSGELRWFYEDGGNLYEGRFQDDKPDGTIKLSLASGVVISERTYKHGEPDGTWATYDANGKPSQEFGFKKGQKDGRALLKYPSGEVAIEIVWKDGHIDGQVHSYYQGGQMAAACNYEHERLRSFQRFHKTGETSLDGHISDQEKGLGQFSMYRINATPVLSCDVDNWNTQRCRVFNEQSQEMTLPRYENLVAHIGSQSAAAMNSAGPRRALKWQPELCGGYEIRFNFDPLIDYGQELINVEVNVKGPCKGDGLAQALYCALTMERGALKASPCALAGGDEGDLPDALPAVDDAAMGEPSSNE